MDGPSPTLRFIRRSFVGLVSQTRHTEYVRNKCCLLSSWSKLVLYIIFLCQTHQNIWRLLFDRWLLLLKENETSKSFFTPCGRRTTLQRRLAWHKAWLPLLNIVLQNVIFTLRSPLSWPLTVNPSAFGLSEHHPVYPWGSFSLSMSILWPSLFLYSANKCEHLFFLYTRTIFF